MSHVRLLFQKMETPLVNERNVAMTLKRKLVIMIAIPILVGGAFCALGLWQAREQRRVAFQEHLFAEVEYSAHILTTLS